MTSSKSSEIGPLRNGREARVWRFGEVAFDEASLELIVAGEPVELEHRPLELLQLLLQHAGEVITKDEILEAVWPGRVVTEASLTKCVARLRHALNDGEQKLIRTAHGYGYRLAAEVTVDTASSPATAAAESSLPDLKPGDGVPNRPNWQLLQHLGGGGYGDIWLGEQPKTHEKRVFKFARDGTQLSALKREITLFRVLNENLGARRDFARILDWNLEAEPYFIELEWSPEGNLLQWTERNGGIGSLPMSERLRLAIEIAEALAAAHSVAVLHKDLKPSNILIHRDDAGTPHVRLSDFGSGRVLDIGTLDRLGITRMGFTQTMAASDTTSGTPLYLAPELIRGGVPTVQADIYALGVMLYQLAIGDFQQPLAPGWEERIDDELLREDIAAAAAGDPQRRLADAAQLGARLRTLDERHEQREQERRRKAEAERTAHALELARARRGLWRALAITLLIGFGVSVWLSITAQNARRRAESNEQQAQAVTDFLTDDIIAAANPFIVGKRDVEIRQVLDHATPTLAQRFHAQPLVLAHLQQAIGTGYAALIEPDKAEPLLLAAEKGLAQQEGDASPEVQSVRRTLLDLYEDEFDLDGMSAVARRMEDAEQAAHIPSPGMEFEARAVLAFIPCYRNAPADWLSHCAPVTRPIYEQALARLGPDNIATLRLEMYVGLTELWPQHLDAALPLLREACAGLQRIYGDGNPRQMYCLSGLATALDWNGQSAEALPIYQHIAQVIGKAMGEDSGQASTAQGDLALCLLHLGHRDEALQIARQLRDSRLRLHGADSPDTLWAGSVLARIQIEAGQAAEAVSFEEKRLLSLESTAGEAAVETLDARGQLGVALLRAGNATRAESLLRQNLQLATAHFADSPVMRAKREEPLGEALADLHRTDEARPLLQDAARILGDQLGSNNYQTMRARRALDALPST